MTALGWQLVTDLDAGNPVAGDIRIVAGRFARLQSSPAAIAQACTVRLRWLFGEWFLDTSKGVPYLGELFTKKGITAQTVTALLDKHLRAVSGVRRLASASIAIDRPNRYCRVTDVVVELVGGGTVGVDGLFTSAPPTGSA